ncbi:hypothetical protein A3C26_04010 [Candidatus Daviesbacteria bacterium RIFCSPHIGHO2_02_FULL_39_12]|uniref:Thioredoxin domain-containing protein n=1 Tax=Candidatus Daviesbacteria bacterium RIFCSPHIGHO2_02_FULL_39_12 TaxID=1797770 RepID=A0A1F5J9T4_9BACT|nr:MAG: hypothetical protein A3C26_04010 [Candidatus Daviesbacteria bacterium RIFCSPHIGHO2_02_FULL_39_12]
MALVLIAGNFNIEISSKGNKNSANQQTAKSNSSSQGSAADHHGGGAAVDTTVFDNLIGKAAPNFSLESYDGKKFSLSELKGKNVLLFFNEGLMCYPACWNQIAAFGKDKELAGKAVVLNITVDPKNNWKQAVDKMPELAQATVLLDSAREVSQKYGVLTLPSSMHKGQFPGHSYVLIDKDGVVRFIQDDVAMAVRNNELLVELDKL